MPRRLGAVDTLEDLKALQSHHPGAHLAEELRALNMSASELARRIRVPTNRVTGILNGQRAITGDTALRLAHFFGTSAEFWVNLQGLHDLHVAEAKSGKIIEQLPTLRRAEPVGEVAFDRVQTPER